MAKHSLFLVHGMGLHEGAAWSDEVWEKLVECSKRYKFFETEDLSDWARPVPIGYDHLIRSELQAWSAQAVSLGAFAKASGLDPADSRFVGLAGRGRSQ
jgi:hypothetical protein